MRFAIAPTRVLRHVAVPLLLAAAPLPPVAVAQTNGTATSVGQQSRDAEYNAAIEAAQKALVKGPAEIRLSNKATLHLPAGASWVPQAEADRYEQALGHRTNPRLLGLVSGGSNEHGWLAVVTFTGEGYVKDDDAAKLDGGEMLKNLRSGQDEDNEDRVARGFRPLVLDDWMQAPRYDAANKWLVWALPVHTSEDAETPTINYNTRALGREGYLSLNLLTDKAHFEADKGEASKLLKAIEYGQGHRYADFNPSTDKVAAYGLAALIGAVALKKLGLLAVASAFILKFAKLGIIFLIGIFAAAKRFLFRGKRNDSQA